jgi:hypothetical protein
VIPSERKRDDLIYNVRMKLFQASALTFERPFDCDTKKDKKKSHKRPVSAYSTVKAKVDSNLKKTR